MASLREQILARIAAALIGATPAGANVFRSREASITRAQTPAITVLMGGETDQRMSQAADKHTLRVLVAIFVRGDPWDQLADTVAVPAHAVLMSDAALWALVLDVRKVASDPEAEEADRTAGTLSVTYDITYLTRASDITAQPI